MKMLATISFRSAWIMRTENYAIPQMMISFYRCRSHNGLRIWELLENLKPLPDSSRICGSNPVALLCSTESLYFGLLLVLSGYFEDFLFSYNISDDKKGRKVHNNEIVLIWIKASVEARTNLLGISSLDIDFTPGLCPASFSLTKVNCLHSKDNTVFSLVWFCMGYKGKTHALGPILFTFLPQREHEFPLSHYTPKPCHLRIVCQGQWECMKQVNERKRNMTSKSLG